MALNIDYIRQQFYLPSSLVVWTSIFLMPFFMVFFVIFFIISFAVLFVFFFALLSVSLLGRFPIT